MLKMEQKLGSSAVGPPAVDHDHLVHQIRVLMSQERAEGDTAPWMDGGEG